MTHKVLLGMLNYYGLQNWWSYGHPKTLDKMKRGILGTCDNQYPTGTCSAQCDRPKE